MIFGTGFKFIIAVFFFFFKRTLQKAGKQLKTQAAKVTLFVQRPPSCKPQLPKDSTLNANLRCSQTVFFKMISSGLYFALLNTR